MGWIKERRPRMFAIQAHGCAPLVRAYADGVESAAEWKNPQTIATGLRVPAAIGDFLILQAVRKSRGAALASMDLRLSPRFANRTLTKPGWDLFFESHTSSVWLVSIPSALTVWPSISTVTEGSVSKSGRTPTSMTVAEPSERLKGFLPAEPWPVNALTPLAHFVFKIRVLKCARDFFGGARDVVLVPIRACAKALRLGALQAFQRVDGAGEFKSREGDFGLQNQCITIVRIDFGDLQNAFGGVIEFELKELALRALHPFGGDRRGHRRRVGRALRGL